MLKLKLHFLAAPALAALLARPSCATEAPTQAPTKAPTPSPSAAPSASPTVTQDPSASPSSNPSFSARCHDPYVGGASYAVGDKVSASKQTSTTITTPCSLGTAGCDADGFKRTTATTNDTRNYECGVAAWCSNQAYEPGGMYSSTAWTAATDQCSGSATGKPSGSPTSVPTLSAWVGGGCPPAYAPGTAYGPNAAASVASDSGPTLVYLCAQAPNNLFCGQAGYEPGVGAHSGTAWTVAGSCSGTTTPTGSPAYVALPDAGGCPAAHSAATAYDGGDRVTLGGLVYECKAGPFKVFCAQEEYAPGGAGEAWGLAWELKGHCSGTISPTSAPIYVALTDAGGCPAAHAAAAKYAEGDLVAQEGLVYKCKAWPFSGYCSQPGYEPGSEGDEWKLGWELTGYCSGTSTPTTSPTVDAANSVGGCPQAWAEGSFEEGDAVSVTVSAAPLRKVAYKCKRWPYSLFCGSNEPGKKGGEQGWDLWGSCTGDISPTASPAFVSAPEFGSGCPADWVAATTDNPLYGAGDRVAVVVSAAPERKVVYQCRPWPNNDYCNQGATFAPGTKAGASAWYLLGWCTGTRSPTTSPVAYAGTCTYNKDVTTETTATCTYPEAGCTCTTWDPPTGCTKTVETVTSTSTTVVAWSDTAVYVEDDVVRVGDKRFKCKGWPFYFWCRLAQYKPSTDAKGLWTQAWTDDGTCPP